MRKLFFILAIIISLTSALYADGCKFSSEENREYQKKLAWARDNTLFRLNANIYEGWNEDYIEKSSISAFHSFISPTQEAIITHKDRTENLTICVSPLDAPDFAWVVPVPGYPKVEKQNYSAFNYLYSEIKDRVLKPKLFIIYPGFSGLVAKGDDKPQVVVHERKMVGVYDTSILSAKDPEALIKWLKDNKYKFPENGAKVLEFYMKKNWYFVVMKVKKEKKSDRMHPVEFTFKTENPVYPMMLTSLEKGNTSVNLYVFADRELGVKNEMSVIWQGNITGMDLQAAFPDYPPYLTVLTMSINNQDIKDDLILAPCRSGVEFVSDTGIGAGIRRLFLRYYPYLIFLIVLVIFVLNYKRIKNFNFEKYAGAITIAFMILFFGSLSAYYINKEKNIHNISECQSNLKNMGTALEMYSMDNTDSYPKYLNKLTPEYLKVLPSCPIGGKYLYTTTSNLDKYTVMCNKLHSPPEENYMIAFPKCGETKRIFVKE